MNQVIRIWRVPKVMIIINFGGNSKKMVVIIEKVYQRL